MINNYKEISMKWVDGEFLGRIYVFELGETIRNEKYTEIEEFMRKMNETLQD
jgi:hypothetical protein